MEKLVSIIVPIYNAEEYLLECLESIRAQKYTNFETILIDDGSTDKSSKICDSFAKKDKRFKVFHIQNSGISSAQNLGLKKAVGDYIAFCDNDDIMHTSNIKLLVEALELTNADIAKGHYKSFKSHEHSIVLEMSKKAITRKPKYHIIYNPLKSYQYIISKTQRIIGGPDINAEYFNEPNWCCLYKKELWDKLRFPDGHVSQDVFISPLILSRAKKVVDVDEILYLYRLNPKSVTHSEKHFSWWEDMFVASYHGFKVTQNKGIMPYRDYFLCIYALDGMKRSFGFSKKEYMKYVNTFNTLKKTLSYTQNTFALIFSCFHILEEYITTNVKRRI